MTSLIPTVSVVEGRPVVSSMKVSEHFGRPHDYVLKSVRRIASDCASGFSAVNFYGAEYTDDQGKPRPMYNLSRDGFTLVAMGFTGKKALEWKIRYIEAFNAMEAELSKPKRGRAVKALPPAPEPEDVNRDFRKVREDLQLVLKILDANACAYFRLLQSGRMSQIPVMEQANRHIMRCQKSINEALAELKLANRLAWMLAENSGTGHRMIPIAGTVG